MNWVVHHAKQVTLSLTTSDDFADWLRTHAGGSPLAELDPYRDLALDEAATARWAAAIRDVQAAMLTELRARCEAKGRMPREAATRDRVLATLVDEAVARDPHLTALGELVALFELAVGGQQRVRLEGD